MHGERVDNGNEPGAGAGGRVGWESQKPRWLFCDSPADTGARRKCRRRTEGDEASLMGDARINTPGGGGADAEAGGNRVCPAIPTGRDGEVAPRYAAQHGTVRVRGEKRGF